MNAIGIVEEYSQVAVRMLQLSFPYLSQTELRTAVDYSVRKRMKNGNLYVENNYKHTKINSTVLEMANYILERRPIITSAGVMFEKHADSVNPLYKLIDIFINNRIKYKKEMFKYPKGSEQFEKYNLLQLLAKLDANALYGAIGAPSSVFYNIFIAESVTTQGQSCTKAAILAFESFLADNVQFGSLNEIVTFIDNVCNEKLTRKYKDSDILDGNIDMSEAFFKIMSNCGFGGYYPSEDDMLIVWNIMMQLGQEDINRLFYKNNLYYFMDNASMTKAMEVILCKLEMPFMDPNHPPKEIDVEINAFWDIMKEYVYYGYQYIDRMDRVETMIRKVAIIADTDSSIISLDAWYRYNLDKYYDIPMQIKNRLYKPLIKFKTDEFGDVINLIKPIEKIEPEYDYNWYTDEIIEKEKLINPLYVIPQEGLRYSIINVIAYCLSKMILDYMERYTMNSNSYDPEHRGPNSCKLVMKNEFLFKRVIIAGKKNYADIQELQEGNIVPKEKGLTVMGMPITKSTLPESTRERLKEILYEDILNCDEIDQLKLLKDITLFEKEIHKNIHDGDRKYFKPVTVKSIDNYSDPMRIIGIKATLVYNALKDDGQELIDLSARNSLDLVKIVIKASDLDRVKELAPDRYDKCIELLQYKQFKDGIDIIALPLNEKLPDWIMEFIDFSEIVNSNLSTFPLDAVGIRKMSKSSINSTNILSL